LCAWQNYAFTASEFDLAVTRVTAAGDLIDTMMAAYGDYGNPYTLFLAAHSQFPQ
jgi:hypothetical protein